jgi:hypothetical protein
MQPPKLILHHYTSGAGLIGILEAGQVWASNIHSLNDAKEFSHAIDLGREAIRTALGETGIAEEQKYFKAFSQQLEYISKISLYVSCFSSVGDSLSQWRGYCPPGFGYCVGFDGETLASEACAQGFRLKQCIYNQQIQRQITLDWAKRNINKMLIGLRMNSEIAEEYVRNTSSTFINEFMEFAPYFKHEAFKDENEWRLIALVRSDDSRLKVRAAKSMLIKYLPIDLHLSPSSTIIWNIKVGPTPHPSLASDAINHYFNKAFIRGGISCSSVPYRDW